MPIWNFAMLIEQVYLQLFVYDGQMALFFISVTIHNSEIWIPNSEFWIPNFEF